ncbi:MAG TPA: pitrilysin family protein [Kofleriaceae bacterium]|jgi:zinc protease
MHRFLLVATLAALASPAFADGDPKIAFEKYKLPNGLEVILAPDPAMPLVAVNIWYHVGSGDEVPGKSGFAHLFEHMMFQGTKHTGADKHFEILRAAGADSINGTTDQDRTSYFEVVPSNQLETALWLESERMGHLLDALDDKQLKNQIDVVRNERRQREDNRPYAAADFAMYEALYAEGHPYRHEVIGLHEDLERASVDDVKRFFKTWYVPANATLTLAGDFDPAEAKQLVAKWFGTFPASHKPEVVTIAAPAVAAKTIEVEDPFAKLREVTFAWHSPAAFRDGDAELEIAARALAEDGTGRLYKTLVYDRQLAQNVRSNQDGMTFSGIFTITVTLRDKAELADVEKAVLAEVARLAHEPLTDREIARVAAQREARAIRSLESLNARANLLQKYNQFLGDPDRITWDLDRFRKASAEQIRATVAKYLAADHAITIVTKPSDAPHRPRERGHGRVEPHDGGGR